MAIKAFERGEQFVPGLVFPWCKEVRIDASSTTVIFFLVSKQQGCDGSHFIQCVTLTHRTLIQAGASLTYVKEQMGHSSIQVTVDTYGHLVPGADIAWVDKLDAATKPQPTATYTQPDQSPKDTESPQLLENIGGPARI